MKITFTTSPKNFEFANYVLGQAVAQLKENPELRKALDLSEKDAESADVFRRALVKGFLKSAKEQPA